MKNLINSGIVESALFILLGVAVFIFIFAGRDSYGAIKHRVLYFICGIGCLNFFIIGAPLLFLVEEFWSKVYFYASIPVFVVCGPKLFMILYDGQEEEKNSFWMIIQKIRKVLDCQVPF